MKILKKIIIFFFLILSFLITLINSDNGRSSEMSSYCFPQVCSYNDPISRYVQFPFLIKNDTMPNFCGYPGFDLLCNKHDKLLINLPNLGLFSVEEIDYFKQELWLNDLDNCLPRKLLSLNGSSFVDKSPFLPIFEQDYWLYNCSNDFFNSPNNYPNIEIIGCLSGQSYGVFASHLDKIVKGNSSLCRKIGRIKVPIGSYDQKEAPLNLRGDIRLNWSQPLECGKCYKRNGRCGFKTYGKLDVDCFNLPRGGLTKAAFVAIALAFAAPLALVSFCILYFAIKAFIYRRRHGSGVTPDEIVIDHQHARTVVIQGLDQSVIESYPKVVLGSSRRLPKPDDLHCPICLGEYLAKESLRTIPHCGHSFHAECIDAWLQLNASCPVCRNSPSRTTLESNLA